MKLVPVVIILAIKIALGSVKGIGSASIRYIMEDNCKTKCIICYEKIIRRSQSKAVYLTACPRASQHIFHNKCLAMAFVRTNSTDMRCPLCNEDCKAMACRALTNRGDKGAAESLQWEMLVCMNALRGEMLEKMLDYLGLMREDYEYLAECLAGSRLEWIKNAVARRVTSTTDIYKITDFYEFLVSKNIQFIPADAYRIALAKCLTSSLSASQVVMVLLRLLTRECRSFEERNNNTANFIKILLASPSIWLSDDNSYALLLKLLRNEMAHDANILFLNTAMLYNISADKIIRAIRCCLGTKCSLAHYSYACLWMQGICMRNLELGEVQQISQDVRTCFATKNSEWYQFMGVHISELYSDLSYQLLRIDEAVEIIKGIAGCKGGIPWAFDVHLVIKYLAKQGIMYTIMHTTREKCVQIFQSMLDSWNADFFKKIYFNFPRSVADIGIDLSFFEHLVNNTECSLGDIRDTIVALARRGYFGHKMLMRMLDVLFNASDNVDESVYIWLLLAAKHQGLLASLECEELNTAFERLKKARLFGCLALLRSSFKGKEVSEDVIMNNALCIAQSFAKLPCLLQTHMIGECADTPIFTIWSKHISLIVKCQLEEQARKSDTVDINLIVMDLCRTEYFAKNVPSAEVKELVGLLLAQGRGALRYMETFFKVARSEEHVHTAKIEIFKVLIADKLFGRDIEAVNVMDFDFEFVNTGFTYGIVTDNNTGKITLVPDGAENSVVKLIRTVGEHYLLWLLQKKME